MVLVARNVDKLNIMQNELIEKYNITVHVISKDLTETNAPDEIFEYIVNHEIPIDILVNNAGFGDFGLFADSVWQTP